MDFRAQSMGCSGSWREKNGNERRQAFSTLSESLLQVPAATHLAVPPRTTPEVQRSAKAVPSKRGFDAFSQNESILGLSDEDDDDAEEAIPTRVGRRSKRLLDPTEFEIPCICYMSGQTDYKKCTKRYRYLSHLARHLHKHDIYICQMCFTKFDGSSKEQNLQRKRQHHCVKVCNNGICKRQQLQTGSSMSNFRTCEHLCTWQERWRELFRAVFPGISPIPALPTPITRLSAPQSLKRAALISPTQEDGFGSTAWLGQRNAPGFAETGFSHRALSYRFQQQTPHSHETRSTGMIQSGSSMTSDMAPTSFTSNMTSSLPGRSQLEAIRGNSGSLVSSPLRHEADFLGNTGLGAAQLGAISSYDEDLVMSDQQTLEFNQSLQNINMQYLEARVDELERQGQNRQERIEALETALKQSRYREQELQLELKAASRRNS